MTPTAEPSRPAGEGGTPDALIWVTVASLLVVSVVLPAVSGGNRMWLVTAVTVPLLAGWTVLQWMMIRHPDRTQLRGRRALVVIVLCTTAAVAVFCACIALAFQR